MSVRLGPDQHAPAASRRSSEASTPTNTRCQEMRRTVAAIHELWGGPSSVSRRRSGRPRRRSRARARPVRWAGRMCPLHPAQGATKEPQLAPWPVRAWSRSLQSPTLGRVLEYASNSVTLVAQAEILPFESRGSSEIRAIGLTRISPLRRARRRSAADRGIARRSPAANSTSVGMPRSRRRPARVRTASA